MFPASWTGKLGMTWFVEMLMHSLCLGATESNFKLCNKHTKSVGQGEETIKKKAHKLLKDCAKFNLSWLLSLPFSGSKKTKLTTGTWVNENWLAWVRVSKIVCIWFAANEDTKRRGGNDIVRMVACFAALMAQLLSPAGATAIGVQLIEMLVKEFLSCVREVDVRVGHKEMNQLATSGTVARGSSDGGVGGEGTGPKNATDMQRDKDQWWLKSNHILCLNLPKLITALGPLANCWDGGRRAERCTQEIEPHVPRGV